MRRHIVSLSSGVPSALVAILVCQEHPDAELWFADTQIENADNYRFLRDIEAITGKTVQVITEGRKPLQVADDEGYAYIPTQRSATCTRELKIKPFMSRVKAGDTVYIGYTLNDLNNNRDVYAARDNYAQLGVAVELPLIDRKILDPHALIKEMGLLRPSMYDKGYPNANCDGCCVKQGRDGWIRTLIHDEMSYIYYEAWEQNKRYMQAARIIRKAWAIRLASHYAFTLRSSRLYTFVRKVVDGVNVGISLRELREEYEHHHRHPNFFQLVDEMTGGACSVECGVGDRNELSIAVMEVQSA